MKNKILIGVFISFCLLFLPYCKKSPTTPELPKKNPPFINSFTATKSEIFKGETTTLSWNVSNATSIQIDNGIGAVSSTGTKDVSPTATVTYTLTASNSDGQVTKTCKIEVKLNLPKINEFKLTPSTINYGEQSELYWHVTNATKVEIDQGIGDVTGGGGDPIAGTRKVSPKNNTTYTLTATNNDGETKATCTLTIKSAANVIMVTGPLWKETTWTFTYFGIVKNIGNKKAWFTKIYIYLYDAGGNLLDYDYNYADDTELDPGETSPWSWSWWDEGKALRNKIDKSKTKYEIKWSEYDSPEERMLYQTKKSQEIRKK